MIPKIYTLGWKTLAKRCPAMVALCWSCSFRYPASFSVASATAFDRSHRNRIWKWIKRQESRKTFQRCLILRKSWPWYKASDFLDLDILSHLVPKGTPHSDMFQLFLGHDPNATPTASTRMISPFDSSLCTVCVMLYAGTCYSRIKAFRRRKQ